MSAISLFKNLESKHDVYRVKDCIKNFCESLREQAMEITNFKKKKINLLTNEQQESYENPETVIKKNLKINMLKLKNIVNLGNISTIQRNKEVLHIAYVI